MKSGNAPTAPREKLTAAKIRSLLKDELSGIKGGKIESSVYGQYLSKGIRVTLPYGKDYGLVHIGAGSGDYDAQKVLASNLKAITKKLKDAGYEVSSTNRRTVRRDGEIVILDDHLLDIHAKWIRDDS